VGSRPRAFPLGALLALTGIFFLNFLGRVVLAPLLPTMEADLGIDHTQAGSLFLWVTSGYFGGLLGSGLISSRMGHRRTVLLSGFLVGGFLLAVSAARGLTEIRFSLLVLGTASGLYLPSGIAVLTALVEPSVRGRALAVHELAPNLGFVAAPLVAELLLRWFSWQAAPAVLGAGSLAAAAIFWRWGRGDDSPGEVAGLGTLCVLASEPAFWTLMLFFSLAIGASLGVYAILPLYLVAERGMEREWVNALVALSRLLGLFASFGAGWAADRLGPRRALGGVFLATGTATVLLGFLPGAWLLVPVFLQPVAAVCFFPPGFAALARIGPASTRNVAVALTVPVAFLLGGGAVPAGIAWFGDHGSFAAGIAVFGALCLGALALVRKLRFPDEDEATPGDHGAQPPAPTG